MDETKSEDEGATKVVGAFSELCHINVISMSKITGKMKYSPQNQWLACLLPYLEIF